MSLCGRAEHACQIDRLQCCLRAAVAAAVDRLAYLFPKRTPPATDGKSFPLQRRFLVSERWNNRTSTAWLTCLLPRGTCLSKAASPAAYHREAATTGAMASTLGISQTDK